MATAYVALGANLGPRADTFRAALDALRQTPGVAVGRVSSFHETTAVGGPPGQPPYLNAAAEIQSELGCVDLLAILHDIEHRFGRVRAVADGPRTLDLDLLLYDNLIRPSPDPVVPHPRMAERKFVLAPLAEIAPHIIHPVSKLTVAELLSRLQPDAPPPPGKSLWGARTLVTGSTSGIGRAIALAFAAAGADVLVHGRRSAETARSVAREVEGHGRRSGVVMADLNEAGECRRLADEAWNHWGHLDVWVNNAGADTLTGEAARWPFERKWQTLLAVDLTATVLLSRDIGGRMSARGGGCILTTGWDQAEAGMEGDSGQLFCAVKSAVMAFTRSLALTLAPAVRVNCVAPGWVRTAWGDGASSAWQERVIRETPLRRWGTPEDVAAAAVWLASPAAAFQTGQTIFVNGGAVR